MPMKPSSQAFFQISLGKVWALSCSSCIGCSEPNFWDGGGFYKAISVPTENITKTTVFSAAVGVAAGIAIGSASRAKKAAANKAHEKVTIDDLEK